MLIVIPGALPDLLYASELAKLLPEHAPTLHTWLQAASVQTQAFDARENGCTAYEAWQLSRAGFNPEPGLPPGAGLGPLIAGIEPPDERPVWLVELAHVALGTDQAALLDPSLMDLRAEESTALLEAVLPLFEDTDFAIEPLTPERWRLFLPDGLRPSTASPLTVAGHRLDTWWHMDAATRPWRKLLNEVQMVWYEHPVNEARGARGVAPVNALWLYGGAKPWAHAPQSPALVLTELDAPQRKGDWSDWLAALAQLDAQHLKPLATAGGLPAHPVELLLLGGDRRATLTLKPRSGLLGWLPATKKNWSAWWSHPV